MSQSPQIANCKFKIDELSDQVRMLLKAKRIIIQLNDINRKQQQETEQYIQSITQERKKDAAEITQLKEKIDLLKDEKQWIDLSNHSVIDQLIEQTFNLQKEKDMKIKVGRQVMEEENKKLQINLDNATIQFNQQEAENQQTDNQNNKQIQELKQNNNKFEDIIQYLNNQIQNFDKEKVELQTKNLLLNNQVQRLKDEQKQNNLTQINRAKIIEQQLKQLDIFQQQVKLLLREKETTNQEKKNLISQIKSLEVENKINISPEIEQKKEKLIEIEDRLQEKIVEDYQNVIQKINLLQKQKLELSNDNQMEQLNKLIKQLNENLQQTNQVKSYLGKRILEKDEQIKKGEVQIKAINIDQKRKIEELSEINKILDCSRAQNDNIQKILNQLKDEKTLLSQIIEKLKIQEEKNKQEVDKKAEMQYQEIVSLIEKPHEIVQEYTKKQSEWCYAIVFNSDQTIMVVGGVKIITVFEFKQGQLNQLQILSHHTSGYDIYTLYFMKKSNQFISGTDKEIGIWSYNNTTKQYYSLQMLKQAHSHWVNRVIMNKNEDLIISCSRDYKIKFWIRKNVWECSQTLNNHADIVWDICLNGSCTQLISCGYDKQILISQQGGDQKWRKTQRIIVQQFGVRICYINDNLIAFQPFQKSNMEIYQLDQQNKQFIKYQDVSVHQNGSCTSLFPMQFNNNKQLLLNKNCYSLNLIRKQCNQFIVQQSINFNTQYVYGIMTDDFKYLITWDNKNKELQVRKQK